MKINLDRFVLAVIATIVIAYVYPRLGSSQSTVPFELISSLGVSLIFFYGLKLSPKQIMAGLKKWKLHMLVQLSTFLFFPFIVLVFYPFVQPGQNEIIWFSFLFLAALPSTVSSSVVMVSIAGGNIPAAIFNASISGLIGIVVTPSLDRAFSSGKGE